jgi:hypothetical protein
MNSLNVSANSAESVGNSSMTCEKELDTEIKDKSIKARRYLVTFDEFIN